MGNFYHKLFAKQKYFQSNPNQDNYVFNHQQMINFKKTNFNNDYQIIQLKGKGASAEVHHVLLKQSKCPRAAKIIRRKHSNQRLSHQLYNQFSILKKLDHPNILKVYSIYQQPQAFYIVTQLCSGCQLFQKISQQKKINQVKAASYFYQILEAVNYLHDHKIMHRDLKPQNLIFSNKTQNSFLKLIDFGSALEFQDSTVKQRRKVGTSYYVAPQVLQKKYNQKCDLWSCGIILYVLLSGEPPFLGKTDEQVLEKILKNNFNFQKPIWNTINQQAKDLIEKLLQKDIDKRLSAKQALNHIWLEGKKYRYEISNTEIKQCLQNIKKFKNIKKMQQAILIFINNFLVSNQQKQRLSYVFKKLDLDKDGILNKQQLKVAYIKYLNYKQSQIQKQVDSILNCIDKNKSGSVDYTEFMMACISRQILISDEKLEKAFKLLDIDGNGKISINQLKNLLGNQIPFEYYQKLVKQFDINGDGQISKDQFYLMMKKVNTQ